MPGSIDVRKRGRGSATAARVLPTGAGTPAPKAQVVAVRRSGEMIHAHAVAERNTRNATVLKYQYCDWNSVNGNGRGRHLS